MILVLGGIKGGSGKTTLATNLTVMRAREGKKVLLVDADEQGSAYDWSEQRGVTEQAFHWTTVKLTGKSLYSQLLRLREDYDDIIVDAGGRDTISQRSALTVADTFLIPFKPRSLDIWTLGPVKNLLVEISLVNPKMKAYAVINQADAKGADNEDAKAFIEECPSLTCIPTFIGHRKSFANAASDGLSVIELKVLDKKAVAELTQLYDVIYKKT